MAKCCYETLGPASASSIIICKYLRGEHQANSFSRGDKGVPAESDKCGAHLVSCREIEAANAETLTRLWS